MQMDRSRAAAGFHHAFKWSIGLDSLNLVCDHDDLIIWLTARGGNDMMIKLCGDTWDGWPGRGWDKDSLSRFAVAALFHIILWRAILQKVILRAINHWRQGSGGSSGGGRGLLVIIRVPARGLLLQHSNTQKENTFLFFINERQKKTAVDWF